MKHTDISSFTDQLIKLVEEVPMSQILLINELSRNLIYCSTELNTNILLTCSVIIIRLTKIHLLRPMLVLKSGISRDFNQDNDWTSTYGSGRTAYPFSIKQNQLSQ